MASNTPLHGEDQTDEDFFDNLMEDGSGHPLLSTSSGLEVKFAEGNDSDDTKAFANLSVGEDSGREYSINKESPGTVEAAEALSSLVADENDGDPSPGASGTIESGTSVGLGLPKESSIPLSLPKAVESSCNSGSEQTNCAQGGTEEAVSASEFSGATMCNGPGGSGVKEVGWSAFFSNSAGIDAHGSYSDFFSELAENAGEYPEISNGGIEMSSYTQRHAVGLDNSDNGGHYDDQLYNNHDHPNATGLDWNNHDHSNANGLDWNSIRYWESMYPGCKFDPATGLWYFIDGYGMSATGEWSNPDTAGSFGGESNGKDHVSYQRQSGQTVAGTMVISDATESASSWNQISQMNNGYPGHMYFHPGYPGWYYDMISQEWLALDSYNPSSHSKTDNQIPAAYQSFSACLNSDTVEPVTETGGSDSNSSFLPAMHDRHNSWAQSPYNGYDEQFKNAWQQETQLSFEAVPKSATPANFGEYKQMGGFHGFTGFTSNPSGQHISGVPSLNRSIPGNFDANASLGAQAFVPRTRSDGPFNSTVNMQAKQENVMNDFLGSRQPASAETYQGDQQLSYMNFSGRSPDGRPSHALVTFGFGGKLIVMKDNSSSVVGQGPVSGSISVLNIMDIVTGDTHASSVEGCTSDYFGALCHQSFPGPLVGGNASSKDLHKWIDERILNCRSTEQDYRKGELLALLLSLLKIAYQHYGKLRSPFGADSSLRESDTPESAVANLFASVKKSGMDQGAHIALTQCLQYIPSEGQMQETARDVQNLLVSGRRAEALQRAQEGQLWGPALIIAAQLGEQFYADTVKQMALLQLVAGTPLRTLCLLIAGQPAEVFSSNSSNISALGLMNLSQNHSQFGSKSMLDDWEENLAVITANRTKDDELVITHLGDSLLKERSEIIAAHICYLVAETNFESYSDTTRLCLVGADHWRFPRTFASPTAIQRTELYEFAKVLGNSQYILLPFQPYKLVYAYMLAEIGKLSDALKYCQAVYKSLKTGRAPEVEAWKQLLMSLEERIRVHQQGGYAVNLAPAKLVGKLLNFFDNTAHRVVGSLPPSAGSGNGPSSDHQREVGPRVYASQSTMTMSSLMSSASMEPISAWAGDGTKMRVHHRSVSEPDFGRSPMKDSANSSLEFKDGAQGKGLGAGAMSRLGRLSFGSQLLQKTVGLVLRPRSSRQAKLGNTNKFYYDDKLKRWVEEGAEPPAEEAALPPPPTTAAFRNETSNKHIEPVVNDGSSPGGGNPNYNSSPAFGNSSGMPPIPSGTNQFSARGRVGIRARYVDTFNQGRASSGTVFKSPLVSSVKPPPAANAKLFVPAPVAAMDQGGSEASPVSEGNMVNETPSTMTSSDLSKTPAPAISMQRFPSMDHITRSGGASNERPPGYGISRRTASWGGSFEDSLSPLKSEENNVEAPGLPPSSTFMPSSMSNYRGSTEVLHEVEL